MHMHMHMLIAIVISFVVGAIGWVFCLLAILIVTLPFRCAQHNNFEF
jgi:hypothetical protein